MEARLADDQQVVERILTHIDRRTTDLSDQVWREPVDHYTSAERFTAEVEQVFKRTPTVYCPSAALPDIGSYIARDVALTPILAVRGSDGIVRAFRNACRHRGVQFAEGAGCAKAFVCRYHGWTYALDGSLRGIPHDYGFPGLDKADHGLVPVPTVEKDGLVWLTQQPQKEAAGTLDGLPLRFGPEWRLHTSGDTDVAANWKIVAEGFLEGYHIRTTHAETFYPVQYDNLNLIEAFGRNSRVAFPYQRIEKLRAVPPSERKTAGMVTFLHHLFPNVMVSTFPTNINITVLEPLAVDRTRLVNYVISNRTADEDGRAALKKGRDFVTAGTVEDRQMAAAAQRGLASGANSHVTFGLFEGALLHFHRNLHTALGE